MNPREKWNIETCDCGKPNCWSIATCPECGAFIGAWLEGLYYPDSCYKACPECGR